MLEEKLSVEEQVAKLTYNILEDYKTDRAIDQMDIYGNVEKDAIIDIVKKLQRIVFPGFFRDKNYRIYNPEISATALIEDVIFRLQRQMVKVLKDSGLPNCDTPEGIAAEAQKKTFEFFARIPKVRAYIDTDLQATLDGDPAACNKAEIIYAYPGLFAISVNRLAHELYLLKVPLIPRIMTEYAHNLTGIDIHPGATIGKYFFIDHGTGIVVGETTRIGENVKLYQGVTLGALSTRGGQKLRGTHRHPCIEDNVTIYAGASILGGDTVIGHDSVIGSNVFITAPVKPGTRVSVKNQELDYGEGHGSGAKAKATIGQSDVWLKNE